MAKPLSEEEVAILKDAFNEYDTDKGGNITCEEFGRVMRQSGQNPSDEELAQIIKEVDLDGDGTINFDEFIAMMTGRTRQTQEQAPKPSDLGVDNPEEEWKSAWKEFDHSLKGSITAAQLRQVLGSLGEIIGDAEIDNVIMNSVNAEDKISYTEFVEFMKGRSPA